MKRAMVLATRVGCNKESDGFGGKSNGNKGGMRLTATRAMAMATATTWVMVVVTRLAGDEEGKGDGGKGDGDGDDGDGRQRGNGDGGKSDGNGDNGGGRAIAMATKRVMVMVTATRVGAGGGRRNEERLLREQGWRARNSIQGDGEGNGDAMARPTLTTMFDVRGGGGQRPSSSRAPRVTLGVRGRREDKTTARQGATQEPDGAMRQREGGTVRGRQEDESVA